MNMKSVQVLRSDLSPCWLCSDSLSAETPHLAVGVGVCGGLPGDGGLQAVG